MTLDAPAADDPVAWHLVALLQEMALREALVAPDGAGTVSTDHFSTSVPSAERVPTAMQLLLLAQDTP